MPLIYQAHPGECGLVCFSMILGFYGIGHSSVILRRDNSSFSRGTSILSLSKLGGLYGFQCRVFLLSIQELQTIHLPAILHWKSRHYVVLKSLSRNSCTLHDPELGELRLSLSELNSHFTGYALELTPELTTCIDASSSYPFHSTFFHLRRYMELLKLQRRLFCNGLLLLFYVVFAAVLPSLADYYISQSGSYLFIINVLVITVFSLVTLLMNCLFARFKSAVSAHSQSVIRSLFLLHLISYRRELFQVENSHSLMNEYRLLIEFSSRLTNVLMDFCWYLVLSLVSFAIIASFNTLLLLLILSSCVVQILILQLGVKKRSRLSVESRRYHFEELNFLNISLKDISKPSHVRPGRALYLHWSKLVEKSLLAESCSTGFCSRAGSLREFVFVLDFSIFISVCWFIANHNPFLMSHFYVLLLYKQIFSRSFAFVMDKWSQLSTLFKYLPYYTEFIELYSKDDECIKNSSIALPDVGGVETLVTGGDGNAN